MADGISAFAGAIVGAVIHFFPKTSDSLTPLVWEIPIGALATAMLVRVVAAPFWIWRDDQQEIGTLRSALAPAKRDTALAEAVAYVYFREWGRSFYDAADDGGEALLNILDDIRQHARDDAISVWGKPDGRHGLLERIDPDYWIDHLLNWFALVDGEANAKAINTLRAHLPEYRQLMVCAAEFEREWPKRV